MAFRNTGRVRLRNCLMMLLEGISVSDLRESVFDYTFVCQPADRLHLILSILPGKVSSTGLGKFLVRVKKSDVMLAIRHMRNPAQYACRDEYSASLARYMELEFTSLFVNYTEQIYENSYKKFKQGSGVYGGRLLSSSGVARYQEYYFAENVPLCFPDSTLLECSVCFTKKSMCYVFKNVSGNPGDSILLEAAKMRLQQLRALRSSEREEQNWPYIDGAISCFDKFIGAVSSLSSASNLKVSCCDFIVIIREIMGDSGVRHHVEHRLYQRQVESHVNRLRGDFLRDCDGANENCEGGGVITSSDASKVQEAILGLQQVKRIVNNPSFVHKFAGKSGVLRAQRQYFRCINSAIDAEIVFLNDNVEKLTTGDLKLFLHKTCKSVSSDIGELLAVYDYEATGRVVYRDAVIRLSKSEVRDLTDKVRGFVNAYNMVCVELDECKSLEEVRSSMAGNTDGRKLGLWEKSLLLDLSKIFSIDADGKWVANTHSRNALLLSKMESHTLSDLIHGLRGSNDSLQLVDSLFTDHVSTDQVFNFLRTSVRSRDHEWIRDIEYSAIPRSMDVAYKISRYLPFHSLWLPILSPGRYRARSGYVAAGFKDWLYMKRSIVAHTKLTSSIAQSLYLDDFTCRLVSGSGPAATLSTSFKVRHNISGSRERIAYRIRKLRTVLRINLAIVVSICVTIGVLSRILGHFGIVITRSHILIHFSRAVFDSLITIAILDAIVEYVFLLAINVACLVAKGIDFILLSGALSSMAYYARNSLAGISSYAVGRFYNLHEIIHEYGFRALCFLMLEKVFYADKGNAQTYTETLGVGQTLPGFGGPGGTAYVCGKNATENSPAPGKNTRVMLSQSSDGSGLVCSPDAVTFMSKKRAKQKCVFTGVLGDSFGTVASELYGERVEVLQALESFKSAFLLPQSTVFHKNYFKLKRGFYFLMNNYPEELRSSVMTNENPSIFNSCSKRRDVYDVIAAVNANTRFAVSSQFKDVVEITSPADARTFLDQVRSIGPAITVGEVNEKIAAVKWAIATMAAYDISYVVSSSEVIFRDARIERSCAIALMDCARLLEDYRDLLLEGKTVGRDAVLHYIKSNFLSYIRDTCHILDVVDRAVVLRHSSASYRKFCDTMCQDFAMLESASPASTRFCGIVGKNLGLRSGGAGLIGKFMEVFGYKHLRGFLLSLFTYKCISYVFGEYVKCIDGYSKISDIAVAHSGFDSVYGFFTCTEYGSKFLEFFWTHVSPKDAATFTREVIMAMTSLDDECISGISHTVDQCLYKASFHPQMHAVREVRTLFNRVADLCCAILQVHAVKKVINERQNRVGAESLEFYLQREKETVDEQLKMYSCNGTACTNSVGVLHGVEVLPGMVEIVSVCTSQGPSW